MNKKYSLILKFQKILTKFYETLKTCTPFLSTILL